MPARIALLALLGCLAGFAEVRVWQSTITLPTYHEGPPDENPPYPLFQASGQWQYPYTSRRTFTARREVVTWRTIEIENEYLKCTVLPDLGGRIYNCVDKVSRRDLFYANPVIKKSDVAVRGAWAAAGTEFNFPIGHARLTVSPVDYAMKKNADGSAAVLVGATDRADGLRWLVEIKLRPGSSVVEQHVILSNPSPVRRRYYWWNNASVQAYEDTHFYLACYLTTTHGGADVEPWPVNSKHVDMSALANHKSGGFARFAAACREGFLGVYSKTDAGGTAHYADPEKLPGKKLWSWGTDQAGREASKNYTDDGSQYVEIQAGLFEDQETYGYLNPHQQRQFDEYWMPVRAIGGITRVNTEAALYMERAGTELRVTVNTYRAVPGAVLRVFEGDRAVFEEKAELEPGVIWKRSVSNAQVGAVYRFELSDEEGRVLLRHTQGLYDALPAKSQAASKPDTSLQEAEKAEAEGNLLEAARKYDELLGRDANQPGLQLAAGRVALELNRVASAHEHLMKGMLSGELRFYRGIDYADAGDEAHAKEDLTAAAEDGVFGSAARLELAKLLARSGDREGALKEVQTAMRTGGNPSGAGDLEVVLLHSLGRTDQAMKRLGDWVARDPADSLLLLEQTLLAGKDLSENEDLLRHLAADPERVLDLVTFYMQTGVYATALDLLSRKYPEVSSLESEPGAVLPQNYPLVAYYRGYCRMKMGASPDQDFALAAKQRALYVFPNRVESFTILEEAIRRNPADANAEYFLGSLYLAAGLTDPAVAAWREAVNLHSEAPALHATLGRLLQQRKEDAAALAVLSEGNRIDPANKAVQDALIKSLEQKREELAKQTKPNFFVDRDAPPPATPEEFATLALNMLLAGRIGDAGALFNQRNFPKDRQSLLVREAFIETRLRSLLDAAEKKKCPQALAAVEAIGDESGDVPFSLYGFGNILKMPRIQYELGVAEATCGEEKAARKRWSKLVKVGEKGSGMDFGYSVLAAIRLGGKAPAGGATLPAGLTPAEQAYVQGLLEMAAGSKKEAAVSFQKGVKEAAQDPMLRYLCQRGLLGM